MKVHKIGMSDFILSPSSQPFCVSHKPSQFNSIFFATKKKWKKSTLKVLLNHSNLDIYSCCENHTFVDTIKNNNSKDFYNAAFVLLKYFSWFHNIKFKHQIIFFISFKIFHCQHYFGFVVCRYSFHNNKPLNKPPKYEAKNVYNLMKVTKKGLNLVKEIYCSYPNRLTHILEFLFLYIFNA